MRRITEELTPLDLDLLTADQVAQMLGSTRSTILQIKHRIGFTKPVKEVFFRFEDVARYSHQTTYRAPAEVDPESNRLRTEQLITNLLAKTRIKYDEDNT